MQALQTAKKVSFKNILFLTDFSEASHAAMAYAIGLARHYGPRLYPAYASNPIVLTEASATIVQEIEDNDLARLNELAAKIGMASMPLFVRGSVAAAVPGWIAQHDIDLIVMGTSGRKGLSHFLLGSVAEVVFRQATCPVLTVGPHVATRPLNEFKPERILVPTDLGPHAEFVAEYALSVAEENHSDVTFIHVISNEQAFHGDQPSLTGTYTTLKKIVPDDAKNWCNPVFMVEVGDPAKKLLHHAENKRPDLIILGLPASKKFNGHFRTGVTYNLVAGAPCPVLTLRDTLNDN